MADVGDIRPAQPVWPKRPSDRIDRGKDQQENNKDQHGRREKNDKQDDGKPHIDEYA